MRCRQGDIAVVRHYPVQQREGTLVECLSLLGRSRCRGGLDVWHENVWHVRFLAGGADTKNGYPLGIPDEWLYPIRGGLLADMTSGPSEAQQ